MLEIFNKETRLDIAIDWLIDRLLFLKQKNVIIQAQPLGMMRLALNGQKNSESGLFLHFFSSDLPKSMKDPPLHTHVFHLKSRIICGVIKDTTFKTVLTSMGNYQLIDAKCTEKSCCMINLSNIKRANLDVEKSKILSAGEIYEIPKGTFHITSFPNKNKSAITIIEKSKVDNSNPILAIPFSSKPVLSPFLRDQLDQTKAWDRILGTIYEQKTNKHF